MPAPPHAAKASGGRGAHERSVQAKRARRGWACSPLPPRALIVTETLHRNITVSIASRTPLSNKFLLQAASTHGNLVIRLPRDFAGPVRYRSETMRSNSNAVRFTPGIRPNLSIFAQEETEGYAFIGDLAESGYLASAPKDEGPPSSTASITSPSVIGDAQEPG